MSHRIVDELRSWALHLTAALSARFPPPRAALGLPRYKFGVQVVIAEAKSQGFRMATRALWDPASDDLATESFSNVRTNGGQRAAWCSVTCSRALTRCRLRASPPCPSLPRASQENIFAVAVAYGVYLN